jgi:hypothetical protein
VTLVLLFGIDWLACATAREPTPQPKKVKKVMTADELRTAVHERVPELAPETVPVLFEVDDEVVETVRSKMGPGELEIDQLRRVVRLIMSPEGLGLRYDRGSLGTAAESLERGTGNCLSLAAVLIGVARGLGWKAEFTEMSLRDDELVYEADVAISEEHMGAKIRLGHSTLFIDYSGRMSFRSRVRSVSDLRATAQYYSNHAYELLHDSHVAGEPVPWEEVERRFEIATRIEPELAQAWNNLGVARSRMGDVDGAERAYERAIRLAAGRMKSAERNLRMLHGLPPEPEDAGRPGVPAGWSPVEDAR